MAIYHRFISILNYLRNVKKKWREEILVYTYLKNLSFRESKVKIQHNTSNLLILPQKIVSINFCTLLCLD